MSEGLKQAFDLSLFWEYRLVLLHGLAFNVLVFLCAAALALCVGLLAALLRVNRHVLARCFGSLHVELFRNAPDYIMLVWVHFVLPLLIAMVIRRRVEFHPFASAVIALGLVYSGYFAETFRAGIEAIPRGNIDAGRAVGIVIEADAIETILVLLRARARNGQLLSESAIAAIGSGRKTRLGLDRVHAGLEGGQVCPTAAIQRKLAHGVVAHERADVRADKLYVRGLRGHLDNRVSRSQLESEVEDLLRSNGNSNSLAGFRIEAPGGDSDFVLSRQEVRGGKKAFRVGHDRRRNSGRNIGDGNLGPRYGFPRGIADGAVYGSPGHLRTGGSCQQDCNHQEEYCRGVK